MMAANIGVSLFVVGDGRRLPLEARDPAHNKIIFHEDVGADCTRLAAEVDATTSLVVTISPA
jgi:hypothetical protein